MAHPSPAPCPSVAGGADPGPQHVPTSFPSLRNLGTWALGLLLLADPFTLQAETPDPAEQRDFFESRIRPVLVAECLECHSTHGKRKAGLALDHRDGWQTGGDSGPAIVPGHPEASLLYQAITHAGADTDRHMPPDRPQLPATALQDFRQWIASGALDPRDQPPAQTPASGQFAAADWATIRQQRAQWWSFQPITDPAPPRVRDPAWSPHPVDRFLQAARENRGLSPAPPADDRTVLRRLSYVLRGLPPTPEETSAYLADTAPGAYERLVDRCLESPHFGEHWTRHWLDWMRYAETHGSEGDPPIPFAWRYRDYLVRALNTDVPYDQLVREHLAGDLLPQPRLNPDLGLNESTLGTAHYRFVLHGFAPTDALDELVRFTDNQIDVLSKAFLGITISCARCHDHKFDPISQKDFYALFGILASCHPALIQVDSPPRARRHQEELRDLKNRLRHALADAWLAEVVDWTTNLQSPDAAWSKRLEEAAKNRQHPLHPLARLKAANPREAQAAAWTQIREEWQAALKALRRQQRTEPGRVWDLTGNSLGDWSTTGNGLLERPSRPGEFHVLPEGPRLLDSLLPAGVYTHLLSSKHSGVLTSARFPIEGHDLYVLVAGDGNAAARYVVQNYPRNGTVYPVAQLKGGHWRWQKWDVSYWQGDHAHLEFATAADQPVLAKTDVDRSWFGFRRALLLPEGAPAPKLQPAAAWAPWFHRLPDTDTVSPAQLAQAIQESAVAALYNWKTNALTDAESLFLDDCVQTGLLPTDLAQLPESVRHLTAEYRRIEARVPVPTRAPGVLEGKPFDQPLFVRGNHKQPADPVPRGFLEVINPEPYHTLQAGRLELAEDLLRDDNPLTRRVIVNRIWHHVFGRGLVPTPDNFGRLGQPPSHPDLLDWLASRFKNQGGSFKQLIRELVTTKTFRLDAQPPAGASEQDPDNTLLTHAHVRRLEAESIRDTLLAVSGKLDRTLYGPPVDGTTPRRSLYLRVIRNQLDPFLNAFDAPVPVSTKGRRDETNVPAQSLLLLNDPFVWDLAETRGRELAGQSASEESRITALFEIALNRPPSAAETRRALEFLHARTAAHSGRLKERRQLETRLERGNQALAELEAQLRQRVLRERNVDASHAASGPQPMAHWTFDNLEPGANSDWPLELHGGARIDHGALVLPGDQAYASVQPPPITLQAKSLEALVQLDTLKQRGGGVFTVQDRRGDVFDAIVFGEKDPGQWLAGSDHFNRTQSFSAPPETVATREPVHVVITYAGDGTITAYRNGEHYGRAYHSDGPVTFQPDDTTLLFGLRHASPAGNRLLKGRILEAKLYDRALDADEVRAAFQGDPTFVSRTEMLAARRPDEIRAWDQAQAEQAAAQSSLAAWREAHPEQPGPHRPWQDLVHAVFNLKELVYLR